MFSALYALFNIVYIHFNRLRSIKRSNIHFSSFNCATIHYHSTSHKDKHTQHNAQKQRSFQAIHITLTLCYFLAYRSVSWFSCFMEHKNKQHCINVELIVPNIIIIKTIHNFIVISHKSYSLRIKLNAQMA